jgi:NADH-quinone oxidoreductase subunit M
MAFHFPWLALAIAAPLLGALWVRRLREPDTARRHALIVSGLTLLFTIGAWAEFETSPAAGARDDWDLFTRIPGETVFVVDALNVPLLALVALLSLLTVLATRGTKERRFSFARSLVTETILLATLGCRQPWIIIGLLAAGTIPPWIELRSRHQPTRVFTLHMALFVILLVAGQSFIDTSSRASLVGAALLMTAVLVRSGIVPLHGWMVDLFERASFGTALLFVTPMVGAYAAVRLVLPTAPDWALHGIAILSLITALYAAGMALVQREARRFYCYLFLSHSSLVFVGLETATPIGLTGALCVWISAALSLTGFGLALRSVEARTGRLSLDEFHGLFEHIPRLATLFLLTGLASVGFPGTAGFVGAELLVEGAVQINPLVGLAIVVAAALNGLAVLHAYFRVFTGTRHVTSIDLQSRPSERAAVLILAVLLLGGGLYPQPGVASRYRLAAQLIGQREERISATDGPRSADPPDRAIGETLLRPGLSHRPGE